MKSIPKWLCGFVVAGVMFQGSCQAADASLKGLLPKQIPTQLEDAANKLPEKWKAWGDELIAALATLYEAEDSDAAAQQTALATLRGKLASVDKHLADPAYSMLWSNLGTIRGQLGRRLALFDAALAAQAGGNDALRTALTDFFAAYEGYTATGTKEPEAKIRAAYSAIRAASADKGAAFSEAFRPAYFNYNLRFVGSEAFIGKFVAQRRNEAGNVDDCILGAKVDGYQCTAVDVSLDLIPSAGDVRFDINLNGSINSHTQGVKDPAVIFTEGNHQFFAQKRVIFDGDKFWTEGARIGVNPNNQTVGAWTKFSKIPLFGRLTEKIAINEAEKRRPESEAIAVQRISSQVVPRFDADIDTQLGPTGQAALKFDDLLAKLKANNLYPDCKSYVSTDTQLFAYSRTMNTTQLGGSEPPPVASGPSNAVVQLHQSLLNHAFDELHLQGRSLTEDQLRSEIETQLSELFGRAVPPAPAAPADPMKTPMTLQFDQNDPIRVQIEDDQVILQIRAGIERPGEETLPAQLVTVPLKVTIVGDKLVATAGGVKVGSVDGKGGAAQIVTATKIREAIQKQLPPREFARTSLVQVGQTKVPMTVVNVTATDGWLTIVLE